MTRGAFAASIREFGDKALARADEVYSESIQDVMQMAQTTIPNGGRMPVDTGFLRNSLASELNGAVKGAGPESYTLVSADLKMGDSCAFSWTAAYALRQEMGFVGEDSLGRTYSQAGKHFAGSAAAEWQTIVAKWAAKAAAQ